MRLFGEYAPRAIVRMFAALRDRLLEGFMPLAGATWKSKHSKAAPTAYRTTVVAIVKTILWSERRVMSILLQICIGVPMSFQTIDAAIASSIPFRRWVRPSSRLGP